MIFAMRHVDGNLEVLLSTMQASVEFAKEMTFFNGIKPYSTSRPTNYRLLKNQPVGQKIVDSDPKELQTDLSTCFYVHMHMKYRTSPVCM